MNRFAVVLLLACSVSCLAQAPQIKSGSTVYVAPMHGYEAYVIAALQKKHVPVVVILDQYKADYIIGGTVDHQNMTSGQPSVVVNQTTNVGTENTPASGVERGFEQGQAAAHARMLALGETSTSLSVLEPKTTAVVFSYASGKMGNRQLQRTAEDFANHLKKFIEKSEKPKK